MNPASPAVAVISSVRVHKAFFNICFEYSEGYFTSLIYQLSISSSLLTDAFLTWRTGAYQSVVSRFPLHDACLVSITDCRWQFKLYPSSRVQYLAAYHSKFFHYFCWTAHLASVTLDSVLARASAPMPLVNATHASSPNSARPRQLPSRPHSSQRASTLTSSSWTLWRVMTMNVFSKLSTVMYMEYEYSYDWPSLQSNVTEVVIIDYNRRRIHSITCLVTDVNRCTTMYAVHWFNDTM